MTTFDRIKETAKQRGLSLNQLNEKANFKNKIIYSWKTKTPSVDKLKVVADVLGVSVDYLLGNTDDTMPSSVSKDTELDLDQALAEKGLVMKFNGKELSDKAKKGLLNVLEMWEEE
ncbi:helix-turn-helix domain-containing protein [Weissella tructae]